MTNLEIVKREFQNAHWKMFGHGVQTCKAYEAPAAEQWVVIINEVAWVASSDREEFVFWGPKGVEPVSFELPEDWNV